MTFGYWKDKDTFVKVEATMPTGETMICFECSAAVAEGKMEKHLREAHRLSVYGEPLPPPAWKLLLIVAVLGGLIYCVGVR